MLIGVARRFVFIANSKTASTSIEDALLPHTEVISTGHPERKHITMQQALRRYAFLFDQPDHAPASYFRFGVMREPIAWIMSWHRYRLGNQVAAPLPPDTSFADFWHRNDWNITRSNGTPYGQAEMFTDDAGHPLVDVIIPHDDVGHVFPLICRGLGITATLPHRNASQIKTPPDMPPHLEARIRAHYATDYRLWDSLPELNRIGLSRLERVEPVPSLDIV